MAKRQEKKGVNLFVETKQPKTQWDKFYEFTVGIGRTIILVVMAIVLGAFGWRFTLDRQVIDLEERLEQQAAVLDSLKETEDDARALQLLLSDLETLRSNQPHKAALFASLLSARTDGTQINSFVMTNEFLNLSLRSDNAEKFNEAENTYKQLPILENVLIPNSSVQGNPADPEYVFSITADIKQNVVDDESLE